MKDDRLIKTSEEVYKLLDLTEFPNFHKSGSVTGMRNKYYGKDALLVQAGDYIYHVDEDTFAAVKDANLLEQTPEWLREVADAQTAAQRASYYDNVIKPKENAIMSNPAPNMDRQLQELKHERTIVDLAAKAATVEELQTAMQQRITEPKLRLYDSYTGEYLVSYKLDGKDQPLFATSKEDAAVLDNIPENQLTDKLKQLVVTCQPELILGKEKAQQNVQQTDGMVDKIGAVLESFYSLHEAEELTRIITDPTKSIEDVKACLDVIRQQNRHEQMRDRITSAMLIPGEGCRVFISAQIDGKLMPRKELTEADVQLMGSEDLGALNETSLTEKVKGLALTYYKDVLSLPPVELVDAEEVMQPLTRDDLHSYMELEQALQKKFPEGLTLQVPQFTTDELFNYIIYDKFHDDNLRMAGIGEQVPPSEETLQVEVHIPADKLGFLIPSPEVYNDDSYSYAINDFEVQDVCEAGVSELMHKHPDLQGAVLDAEKWLLLKYMRVEGRPLDACLAWILQDCKLDVPQLKQLMNDTALAEQKLADIRKAGFSDYDRQRLEKIGSPKLLDMTHNRYHIYFHEKGTLGFAVVDRARGVTYSGETLSREAQDFINDFASNKNLQVGGHHTFFQMPGVNSEKRAYLDTMKEKLVLADIQQNAYGGVMTTNGMNVLNEGDMQHFQDITGRVTDARIIGIDKPKVRCKIDGEQQMARPLGKSDIIRCGNFMSYSDEMKSFALSMAVKYFATDLYDNREQQQSKGMGR